MKILYVTTIGLTMIFFKSFIKDLIDAGNTVEIATNESEIPVPECYREWGCKVHQISCSRNPLKKSSITAVKEIKALVEREKYDIVHCHTPVAAMCTRLACRKSRKNGTKVLYTAHGFHFYKGAPLLNWLIYYPVEKVCSYFTDTLITMNKEDFALAKKKMKAKKVEYVPGVGIDLSRFQNVQVDRNAKRKEIGVPEDATLLLSVGELNENKNHEVIIRAIAQLNKPNIHYAIAGKGDREAYLLQLAKELGVSEQVHLLGYRTDVAELYKTADIYTLPSIREGLNVSLMEAMASGLPCAVGNIRGNIDLIDENGGVLFDPSSVENCKEALNSLLKLDFAKLGEYNVKKIESFSVEKVNEMMFGIYEKNSMI